MAEVEPFEALKKKENKTKNKKKERKKGRKKKNEKDAASGPSESALQRNADGMASL